MSPPTSVLLVAYSFPPVGGAGVQRMLKLAKYLPEYGFRVTVLTVKNPSVPVFDHSLLDELPREVDVVRATTLEPGYAAKKLAWQAASSPRSSLAGDAIRAAKRAVQGILAPDPQLLWLPDAARRAMERAALRKDDIVLISGPPFSAFLLAPLFRAASVRVFLDYRDEWSTYRESYEMGASPWGKTVGHFLEPRLLRAASGIVTATPLFRDNLLSHYPFLHSCHVHSIPNGYDLSDFRDLEAVPTEPGFVLGYAGTVFRLTRMVGLLEAVRRVHEREPTLSKKLRVRIMGRVVETEEASFSGMEALGVERVGYVAHDKVLGELSRCHATLCVLSDVPGTERIYPAKIFELMALGRPIVTLAPPGALANLVSEHKLGTVIHPDDVEGISAFLLLALRNGVRAPEPEGIARFDRRALAGEFAQIFGRRGGDRVVVQG